MGHVKYMTGNNDSARDCYERTLSFVSDASEMHSIYLRLASIYLQDARVGKKMGLQNCSHHLINELHNLAEKVRF